MERLRTMVDRDNLETGGDLSDIRGVSKQTPDVRTVIRMVEIVRSFHF